VTITFADGERRRVARNDHPVRPMPLIPFREYRPDVTDYAQSSTARRPRRTISSESVFCERKNRLGHIR
jgi:hypothetical protein